MGSAGPCRASVRSVGGHESLPVREDQPRRPILRGVAAEGLDGAGHPGACVRNRPRRSRRPPLATAPDHLGRRAPGGREPRVRLGARQIPREGDLDPERRAGPAHGIHCVWSAGPCADRLTS